MKIVANSCVGGHIYNSCIKSAFQTPFIWNIIDVNSMINLIKNFSSIDYNKIKLYMGDFGEKKTYILNIDNKVNVKFVHYRHYDPFEKPVVKGIDVFYKRIKEYIIEKYKSRLQRMKSDKSEPIFILADCFDRKETLLNDKQLEQLNELGKKHKIIVAVDAINKKYKNLLQIDRKYENTFWLGKAIYDKFIK